MVFANELHRRYGDQGVVSVSLHPGNLKTDLQRHVSSIEKVLSASLSDMVDRCQCADGDPGTTAASCVDGSAHTAMGWDLSGRDRSWRTGMLSTDERSVLLLTGVTVCSTWYRGHGWALRRRRHKTRAWARSCGRGWRPRSGTRELAECAINLYATERYPIRLAQRLACGPRSHVTVSRAAAGRDRR